jgi:hypothetical protein
MRTCLIVMIMELYCAGMLQAQPTYCTVTGFLFNPNGSPAAQAEVKVISVVKSGSSLVLTPIVLITDATGFTSFAAPCLSVVWIRATALGLADSGDVALTIPDADSATLDVLGRSARPPVSGFNLTSGSSPNLALWLPDFGINLNVGSQSLPLSNAQGAASISANVSSAKTDDAPLSSNTFQPLWGLAAGVISPATATNTLSLPATSQYMFNAGINPAVDFFAATTNNGNYQWTIGSVPNVLDPSRQDQVMTLGWNTTGSGGRLNPGEPALSYRLENYFASNPTSRVMEAHLQYNSAAGSIFRPWAYQVDRASNVGVFQISATNFIVAGNDGVTPYEYFTSSGLTFANGAVALFSNNNVQALQQMNSASSYYVNIAYVDAADRVSIGDLSTGVINNAPYFQLGSPTGPMLSDFADSGVSILNADGTGALIVGAETTTPGAAAAGGFKLYAKQNGAGKTQLCAIFSSGPEQCFATQP